LDVVQQSRCRAHSRRALYDLRNLLASQPAKLHPAARAPKALDEPGPRLDLERPIGRQQQQAHPAQLASEKRQELERRRVGPVQIVEDDDEWRAFRGAAQERGERVEQAEAPLVGVGGRGNPEIRRAFPQRWHQSRDLRGACAELPDERAGIALGGMGANGLSPRPVRGSAGLVRARPPEHTSGGNRRASDDLLDHARLADARIARDRDQPPAARGGFAELRFEHADLVLASDERAAAKLGRPHGDGPSIYGPVPPASTRPEPAQGSVGRPMTRRQNVTIARTSASSETVFAGTAESGPTSVSAITPTTAAAARSASCRGMAPASMPSWISAAMPLR